MVRHKNKTKHLLKCNTNLLSTEGGALADDDDCDEDTFDTEFF